MRKKSWGYALSVIVGFLLTASEAYAEEGKSEAKEESKAEEKAGERARNELLAKDREKIAAFVKATQIKGIDVWDGLRAQPYSTDGLHLAYADLRFYTLGCNAIPASSNFRVFSINPVGKVRELGAPESFNEGLMKVISKEDVQTAAAAVMTLIAGYPHPSQVNKRDVDVEGTKGAGKNEWICKAKQPFSEFEVRFEGDGKCIKVERKWSGPPPPSCVCDSIEPLSENACRALGLGGGALKVGAMNEGSLLDRTGLKSGDIIVSLGGQPLPANDPVQHLHNSLHPAIELGHGSKEIEVLREQQRLKLTLSW